MKKATLNPVKVYKSEEKEVPERSSESDFDFEQVAPRTGNVPKRVRDVKAAAGADLADAQKTIADRPASPEHRAIGPHPYNQIIAKVPKLLPVKFPAHEAAVKVPVLLEPAAVSDVKAQSGATAAPTDA